MMRGSIHWSDEALGRLARKIAARVRAEKSGREDEYQGGVGTAAAHILIGMARVMNAGEARVELKRTTYQAVDIGDWEVIVRRTREPEKGETE